MRIFIYIWEGIKIAFDALRSYKLRSTLTTLGIVIGVTTVITIVALVQGLNKAFADQISAIGTNTLYIQKFPWIMDGDGWFVYRNRPNVTIDEADELKESANLASAVAPTLYSRRTVKYGEKKAEEVLIVGTNADYLYTSNAYPEFGRFLSETDVRHRRPVVILGYDVANSLFPKADPIGKRVTIQGKKFRVIGVLEKKGALFGNNMDSIVYLPIGIFKSLFGVRWRSVDVEVMIKAPEYMEDAEIELTGIMRRVRGLKPNDENNFAINKQSLLMNTYKSLTSTLWAVAIGVGAISLLVGGIGIMNILLVSVTERTREIGIRKAIGARKRDILLQFLIEAMMICAVGVFIGVVLAIVFAKIVDAATPVPTTITLWVALLGFGFVFTIGLFFGIYPASKAARLNPIEALRYE